MASNSIFCKDSYCKSNNYVCDPKITSFNPEEVIPKHLLRDTLPLPNVGEPDVVRHYCRLANMNFSVDTNFYPLGSCTMKYNPKINDAMAQLEEFAAIHPYQPPNMVQGALELMYNLEQMFCEITGMKRFSLQPSSGAQGELTGMLMIRKFHEIRGNKKSNVIVPDSAHGTNPATVSMCGYNTVVIESDDEGLVDIDKLYKLANVETAAIMLTNPNTLGLFEERILDISDIIHKKGGMLYYDGANFNALLGITKPSLMGFDVVHLNLHKTFSSPHGCGGPGSGVVGVVDELKDFLPTPLVGKKDDNYYLDYDVRNSIGRVRTFYGNFSILIRAYVYILRLGKEGLLRVAHNSVLNANYIKEKLKDYYELPYSKRCMHEVVFRCRKQKERGATVLDIAKRLIDFGIHPPTIYFPIIVKEALMIEPTETENKEILDNFIKAMIVIDKEINEDIDKVKTSPLSTVIKRVDEVSAARFPDLKWENPGD